MFLSKHCLNIASLRIGKHRIIKKIASLRKADIAHPYLWVTLRTPRNIPAQTVFWPDYIVEPATAISLGKEKFGRFDFSLWKRANTDPFPEVRNRKRVECGLAWWSSPVQDLELKKGKWERSNHYYSMMSIDHNQFPSYTGNQTQTNQRESREVSSAVHQ